MFPFDLTHHEQALLALCTVFSLIGSCCGVVTAYLDEYRVDYMTKRMVLGMFKGFIGGFLVFVMMIEIPFVKESAAAACLFSLLFGLWAGRSANRQIDTNIRFHTLLRDVERASSKEDILLILKNRTSF